MESTLLQWLAVGLSATAALLIVLLKGGMETLVKTRVEEGVKSALREVDWPAELARELQKGRGLERQELRHKSYGALWAKLKPLAIYDEGQLNERVAGELSHDLTTWYFSEAGGLFLTPQASPFYFALQDLLRAACLAQWETDRSHRKGDTDQIFEKLLASGGDHSGLKAWSYLRKGDFRDWREAGAGCGAIWQETLGRLAAHWDQLTPEQHFSVLQQAGSKLRTALVNDLESRSA